jgi:hypothetical protein
VLLACAAAFVWLTALSLPDVVASHFGPSGDANGTMPRGAYIRFMLTFMVGLPAVLVGVTHVAMGRPGARINLPNRDYWLAPERRDQTVSYLRTQMVRFSSVLIVFLCYAHWLVVRANRVQPPHLSNPAMISGLVAFVVYAIVWTRFLVRRFRNLPLGRSG